MHVGGGGVSLEVAAGMVGIRRRLWDVQEAAERCHHHGEYWGPPHCRRVSFGMVKMPDAEHYSDNG
jgi:hypothetical protein